MLAHIVCILNREETLREKMLQKKLNLKKFMAEDLNNLLNMTETGRYKNRIPGSYVSIINIMIIVQYRADITRGGLMRL